MHSEMAVSGTNVGSIVMLQCEPLYIDEAGEVERTCTTDRTWTGTDLSCIGAQKQITATFALLMHVTGLISIHIVVCFVLLMWCCAICSGVWCCALFCLCGAVHLFIW